MTLSARTSIASITYGVVSGSVSAGDTFNITFPFLENDEYISVFYRNSNDEKTELVLDDAFKVEVSSGTNNVYGLVVMLKPISDIISITIERTIENDQDIDLNVQTLYPNVTEYAFDKLTGLAQDLNFKPYAIHAPSDETLDSNISLELAPASERADKLLGFDGTGSLTYYEHADGDFDVATHSSLGLVMIGDTLDITADGILDAPYASTERAGIVQIGDGISVEGDAIISVDTSKIDEALETANEAKATAEAAAEAASALSGYEDDISTLQSDLSSLQSDITTAQGNIETLQTDIGDAQSDISTLQTDMANAQTDIASLQSDITTAQSDISPLQTNMANAQSDITTLQSDMTTAQSDISTLQSDMSTAQSDISTLQSDMSTAQSDISTLQTKVSGLEDSLSTLASTVVQATTDASAAKSAAEDAVEIIENILYNIIGDWIKTNLPSVSSASYYDVAYGNKKFLISVQSGTTSYAFITTGLDETSMTWTSSTIWTERYFPPKIAYGGGYWVGVSAGNPGVSSYSSDDGATWTSSTTAPSMGGMAYDICYGNGRFITIAGYSSNSIYASYSDDGGNNWTDISSLGNGNWQSIAYDEEHSTWVIVGYNNYEVAYSDDNGSSWSNPAITEGGWYDICYGNGRLVAVGVNCAAWSNDGGQTWNDADIGNGTWHSVAYGNGKFIAAPLASGTAPMMSKDGGETWEAISDSTADDVAKFIAYGHDRFFVAGTGSQGMFQQNVNIAEFLEDQLSVS